MSETINRDDVISRADAIDALGEEPEIILDTDAEWEMHDRWVDAMTSMKSLPSADAVSMEEHVKELNDLAVEWKAKFAKAEKTTDEIYDETMAKVAKECEECKERLRNIHPSAEAVEVVRCKDCKHKYMDGEVTHYYWCRLHDRPVDDTYYCAWGE